MLFDRLALLRPSSLALCALLEVGFGVGGGAAAAEAQSPQPSPAGPPQSSAAPASPAASSSSTPAASPSGPTTASAPVAAPVEVPAAPLAAPAYPVAPPPPATETSQYYGTYAPASNYPSAPSYTGPLGRPPGPGSHEHEGFFLRFTLGVGAGGTSYKEVIESPRVSNVKTRGLAAVFDIAVGGRVVGNFIVHGNFSYAGVDSNREIDGIKDRSYDSLSTNLWMLGAGGTYYFMPTNLYLTLALGTGGFLETRDYGGSDEEGQVQSGAGFATSLAVGKEWWVGGRGEWGIGGSITGSFYSVPVEVGDVKSTALGNVISLAFSSTLN